MQDKRFYNAMCTVMGGIAEYAGLHSRFQTCLPPFLEYIGTLVKDFMVDVYRGHVSLDDAFMHRSFYVDGKFYYTTIFEKGVTVLVSEESNASDYTEMPQDKFASLFCELGLLPSRSMQDEFDSHNSLQTAICD